MRCFVATLMLCLFASSAHASHHRYHHYRHHHYRHHHHRSSHRSLMGDVAKAVGDAVSIPFKLFDNLVRPRKIVGELEIANKRFAFVSGGAGWSIPFGDWKITPDAIGPWGSRHGAIGIAGGEIWDPVLKRDRDGIELHPSNLYATHGCVGIDRSRWAEFKRTLLTLVNDGEAWLHIGPDGASIVATKPAKSLMTWGFLI